jgi:hypothetical protein
MIVMGVKPPGQLQPDTRYRVHRFPARSDEHPIYMFGHFEQNRTRFDPGIWLDEAIFRIREASESTAAASHIHAHHHGHATVAGEEDRAFMFGVNPAQPMMIPVDEPPYCF